MGGAVPFTALISSGEADPDSPQGLRVPGLTVVAGIALLERQARQAERAGATAIVLIAPALPAAVRARLVRHPRLTVVERPDAAAPLLADDARVLAMAPGVLLDDRIVAAMLDGDAQCRLAAWREPPGPGAERIDAQTLWAGVALLPARLARDVLRTLGEWALESTLLRAAVEHGAQRLMLDDIDTYAPARRRRAALLWARPVDAAQVRVAARAVVAAAQKGCLDWPARFIHPPIEDALVRLLLPTPVTPNMVTLATGVLGLAALAAFATGWLDVGLALALLNGPLDGVDGKLARARVEYSRWGDLEHALDKILEYGWYLALGWWFAQTHGLAAWLVAGGIVTFSLAEAVQGEFFRRFTGRQLDDWGLFERRWRLVAGRRNTHFWALVPFAVAAHWWTEAWFAGFLMLLAYALITWGIGSWRLLRAIGAYGRDTSAAVRRNFAATAYDFLPRDRGATREGTTS